MFCSVVAVCFVLLLQCVPFWPIQTDKKKKMIVKAVDSEETSEPFSFVDPHTTLVKLNNKVWCGEHCVVALCGSVAWTLWGSVASFW